MAYYNRNHYRRFTVSPKPKPKARHLAGVNNRSIDTKDGRLQWVEAVTEDGDRMRRVRGEGILNGNPISIHELEERILLHAIWHDPFFE